MTSTAPLLLRAARGEQVERPPVWMMRQAGRYMKVYRDLRDRHPGFRERSENPDLSFEISMQPFEAFKPDGVILFSDILTPLPGMGINFDIVESKGPLIHDPIRSMAQVEALTPLNPAESMPFVVITVTATLGGFDMNLMRAARGLGASQFTAFRRVMLPIVWPGVLSGALFAFATSSFQSKISWGIGAWLITKMFSPNSLHTSLRIRRIE